MWTTWIFFFFVVAGRQSCKTSWSSLGVPCTRQLSGWPISWAPERLLQVQSFYRNACFCFLQHCVIPLLGTLQVFHLNWGTVSAVNLLAPTIKHGWCVCACVCACRSKCFPGLWKELKGSRQNNAVDRKAWMAFRKYPNELTIMCCSCTALQSG